MVAFDADNSKLYTGLNGTWYNSSDHLMEQVQRTQ